MIVLLHPAISSFDYCCRTLLSCLAFKPKVVSTALYQSSSLAAFQSTHSSSLIDARQPRNGIASGPTGCRNCQVSLSAISKILSATIDACVGVLSDAAKRPPNRYE